MAQLTENKDFIDFYDGPAIIAGMRSSIVPPVGAKISIRKIVWTVASVTYAVDHADDMWQCGMRANVDLVRDA